MKAKVLFAVVVLAFILSQSLAQTIHIANNNPGATPGTNVHTGSTAFQDAIDAAVSGDIIHVIPSSVKYLDVIITGKFLTILGVGLKPEKNLGTLSEVDDITIRSNAASGTRVSGVYCNYIYLANDNPGAYTLSNILIENSHVRRVVQGTINTVSNLIIRNNIFENGGSTTTARSISLETTASVVITNNIFQSICCSSGGPQVTGGTIQNNLFYYSGTGIGFQEVINCVIQNNIFYGVNPGSYYTPTGNTYLNNLSDNVGFTMIGMNSNTGSGNIVGSDPMFTNVPLSSSVWDNSWDITLLPGSLALGGGNDGTDIGPTGGATPFDPEGTFLPLIQSIDLPAVVSQGTDLTVNIKAKGN